jgi:prophage regulatory protein
MPDVNHVNRILPLAEVRNLTSFGTSTIYRKMRAGEFPKQIKLSTQSVGWLESEINDWIQSRIAERDNLPTAA